MLQFVSPWSTAHMRSLPWAPGTGDVAGHNPLDPNDARFYENGEWLQDDGTEHVQRGGNNAMAVPGTADSEAGANVLGFIIFGERGRTDLPVMAGIRDAATGVIRSGKVSIVRIHNFEAITDMADVAGITAGDALSVWDLDIGGVVRRVLATQAAGFVQAHCVSVDATAGTITFLVRS